MATRGNVSLFSHSPGDITERPVGGPDRQTDRGDPYDVTHALKCKKGGWVRRRHEEVKRAWVTLFKRVSPTVLDEPHLPSPVGVRFEKASTTTDLEARADILVRGLFHPHQDAYTDVTVVDTAADCYQRQGMSATSVLKAKETRKRGKYEERVRLGGSFAPLACSVYGTLAPEANAILTRVVKGLDAEREEKADAARLQRVYLQIAVMKATSLCIRARSQATPPSCESYPEAMEDCRMAVADAGVRREGE